MHSCGLLEPNDHVVDFEMENVGTGQMAETVRIAYTTNGEAARSVIAKFSSTDEASRSTGLMTRAYEIEVGIYNGLARRVNCRIPTPYYTQFDATSGWFVILLQDIADAAPTDQLAGCTTDEARAAVLELARLHGPCWNDSEFAALEWLNRVDDDSRSFLTTLLTSLWPGFLARYGDRLEPAHVSICEQFIVGLGPWLTNLPPGNTVTHGDFRLDNLLFRSGEARPFVVDWQTAAWGSAAADLAYFLGASLTVEQRRQHEEHLLKVYHDELLVQGVTNYTLSDLRSDVRSLALAV